MRTFYETVSNLMWGAVLVAVLYFAYAINLPAAIMSIDWQSVLRMVGM